MDLKEVPVYAASFCPMKFGQYEPLEPIAIGGMAEVFKGRVVRQILEARAIRIDDADVGVVTVVVLPSDACAVGRPGELRAVRVVVSQLRLIRAVSVHRPDFHLARACAGEDYARAVGRPSRLVVTRGRVRQARDARAVGFRRVNLVVAVAAADEKLVWVLALVSELASE